MANTTAKAKPRDAVRKKVTVYDKTGKAHPNTDILNARDLVQHLGWSFAKPIVIIQQAGVPDVDATQGEETPPEDGEADSEDAGDESASDEGEGEDDDPEPGSGDPDVHDAGSDAGAGSGVESLPTAEMPGIDPFSSTKDDIAEYAKKYFSVQFDKRKTQQELAEKLHQLIESTKQ